jgi:predicted enzyme related to lactoylglutathione lyase
MSNARKSVFAVIPLAILLLAACTTLNVNLPAVTESPTGEQLPGKIVWRDLLTNDPAASQQFYGELFGWEFESIGVASNLKTNTAYTLIRHNGKLIGGMIDTMALSNRSDISQWVVLMSVDDIDERVRRVAAEGGEVVTRPTDLQRRGRLAVVRDAQGALLGLLQSRDGDPADVTPETGSFLWDELWTSSVDDAARFYARVTDLRVDRPTQADAAAANYRLFKSGDDLRAGLMAMPLDGLDPVWVSYLRVENPAAITARVESLGGRVIVPAQPRTIGGEVAFVAGPSGAGIALQTWPLERNEQEL